MTGTLEIHTSELIAACPRRAKLRAEGKETRFAETALVRGLVAHGALERLSLLHPLDCDDYAGLVSLAWADTARKCEQEGRQITAAPIDHREEIEAEIVRAVEAYDRRISPLIASVVAVEAPVEWWIGVDGEKARFASHLDLLAEMADPYTGEMVLAVVDWKWHEKAPSFAYLARNMQMAMYGLAVRYGTVMDRDGSAINLPDLPVRVYWCHLPNLLPYGRAGKSADGSLMWKKGDERSLNKIVYDATPRREAAVMEEFSLRVRMARMGMYPAIPSPEGCLTCNAKFACPVFGGDGGNDDGER